LNGDYNVTFRIFSESVGGTKLCEDAQLVTVTNGLFSTAIQGCTVSDLNGQRAYVEIEVESDGPMTPRQAIYPVPYAYSLIPGARISGTLDGQGMLNVTNSNAGGYAGSFYNSGGGVAINAGGSIQSSAQTFLFVPGSHLTKEASGDSTRWDLWGAGAQIYQGGTAGSKYIRIPITIPAVLYGQPVKVTNLRVYYDCQNGAHNYIEETYLYRPTDANPLAKIIEDSTHRTSNTAVDYDLPTNTTLSADQGFLVVLFKLHFENNTEYVLITGVRLTLEHD
jgi:hypothetical protein